MDTTYHRFHFEFEEQEQGWLVRGWRDNPSEKKWDEVETGHVFAVSEGLETIREAIGRAEVNLVEILSRTLAANSETLEQIIISPGIELLIRNIVKEELRGQPR